MIFKMVFECFYIAFIYFLCCLLGALLLFVLFINGLKGLFFFGLRFWCLLSCF